MADIFDLSDRVAVITGGGTGIGRAAAHVLAGRGARVVLASRKVDNLERVASELRAGGHDTLVVPTDVRDADACEALIAQAVEHWGRLDILVNNAGGSWSLPFEQWTLERWQNMIDLNLRSVFVLSVAASKHMLTRGAGAIVNISSGASELGLPFVAPYGAAKAGVNNLTKTFAGAWTPNGVRVNCIAVGAVASEGFLRAMDRAGLDPDRVGGASNAVGRAGRPEEIAYGILFLVSDAASFVSGETIYMGGGPKVPLPI
ncbi:MAG TPA: SDR family oxidoreductase [Acidimicrobiia bacterium]|nr:SDR family oxidoreductase [Acidimicrobiia bacterium]